MFEAILMAAMATAEPVSLTAVQDSYPHLSPDGRTLAFHSNRSGRQAIWLAEAGGENPRMLYDGGDLGSDPGTPVWSPDGRSIVFAMRPVGATDDSESDVFVMDAEGRSVRRLTETPGDDSHPHWAVDGKRIYFNSARATPDLKADWGTQWIDIYSMNADGSDVRRHTDCKATCTYPVPSPDGLLVAHRRTTPTASLDWAQKPVQRNSEVFVTNLDGSGSVNVSKSPAYDGWPQWSPNGRWLLFASNRGQPPNMGQIFAVRADGSNLRQVTSGAISRVQPSVSFDGKLLFFYENIENEGFEIGHIARTELSLPE